MNELDLYKFITKREIEIKWDKNELIMWLPFKHIEYFVNMLGYGFISKSMEVNLRCCDIAFDLVPICESFDIEPERILEKSYDEIL